METSDEKSRNCLLILPRVYLLVILGIDKVYVLEIELFRLWVGQGH